jgi:hypothetical protein
MQISRHPELHKATRTARWTRRKAAGTEVTNGQTIAAPVPSPGRSLPLLAQ